MHLHHLTILSLGLGATLACGPGSRGSSSGHDAGGLAGQVDAGGEPDAAVTPQPTVLPRRSGEEACEQPPTPPPGARWARSTEAVVWGILRSVRLVFAPAVTEAGGVETLVQQCPDGPGDPALELQLEITHTLWGQLSGVVTVRVGPWQRRLWRPSMLGNRADGLGVDWSDGVARLEPGSQVGLGLHRVATHPFWSLMGEPLFTLVPAGLDQPVVQFQQADGVECELLAGPTDFDGLTLDELERRIAAGGDEDDAAAQRARGVQAMWGSHAADCFAAQCIDGAGEQ